MHKLVLSQGHCCLYAFAEGLVGKNLTLVAKHYGVSYNAMYALREKFRRGALSCQHTANCKRKPS